MTTVFLKRQAQSSVLYKKNYYYDMKFDEKFKKNRTMYEILIFNQNLLVNQNYKNIAFNNKENNEILKNFGFVSIDDYKENLPRYLLEYLDAIVEAHDKFLHSRWHSGHLEKSYDGAFKNLITSDRLKNNIKLLIEIIKNECPKNRKEDWQYLIDSFTELFKDSSSFKYILRDSQKEWFETFLKIDIIAEQEPRKPNMPFLHCSVNFIFPDRTNIPHDLSARRAISNLVSKAEEACFIEAKN
jgi:hypothetical protein